MSAFAQIFLALMSAIRASLSWLSPGSFLDKAGHPLPTQTICSATPTTQRGCPALSGENVTPTLRVLVARRFDWRFDLLCWDFYEYAASLEYLVLNCRAEHTKTHIKNGFV